MLGRIGRDWLRRPAMPVIVLGMVLTGVGLMGGRDGLALTGMAVGGLGIAIWLAMAVGVVEILRPAQGGRPGWGSLAASLAFLPFIGLCVVAPILLLLAYQRGDRSLLNAAAVIGGVCAVVMLVVGRAARWLRRTLWPIDIFLRGVRQLVGPVGGDDPEKPME
jgi:hypothetical protein